SCNYLHPLLLLSLLSSSCLRPRRHLHSFPTRRSSDLFAPFGTNNSLYTLNTPWLVLPFTIVNNFSTKRSFNIFTALLCATSNLSNAFLSASFDIFLARENSFVSITTPFNDGEAFRDASFTSPALSPKIARSNFSSGDGSDSPLGVILPIKISPPFTSAPTRMMPFSSRSLVASSDTFGISEVNSSSPRFVSRTSNSNSSICKEVNKSCDTTRSEITIASSKLYPCQGMNATFKLRPNATSPFSVAYPSHNT